MELIRYLNDCFFTEAQLLAVSGIDHAEFASLQARGVMPQPSYRLRIEITCDSTFRNHAEQDRVDYYAKGYASWLGLLLALPADADAFPLFAKRYRARLKQLSASGLDSDARAFNEDLDAHLHAEWTQFLDGVYGLCTRTGLPEEIASKELASAIIRQITEARNGRALSVRERVCLTLAVDLLDIASAAFAPHERARSSRHRLVDEVRRTYLASYLSN